MGTIWASVTSTLTGLPPHRQLPKADSAASERPPVGFLSGSKFSHGCRDPSKELEGITLHPPELAQTLGEQGGCSEGAGKPATRRQGPGSVWWKWKMV